MVEWMKSPCHDCKLRDEDKNERICTECDARVKYVSALSEFPAELETKKGRFEAMSVKGTCKNCERENMTLPARGLCGRCNGAWWKAPTDGKEAALATAKELVKSVANLKRQPHKSARKKADLRTAEPVTYKIPEGGLNELLTDAAWIEFKDDRDKKILLWIKELANEHRRTLEQQIMWILQDNIPAGRLEAASESLAPEP